MQYGSDLFDVDLKIWDRDGHISYNKTGLMYRDAALEEEPSERIGKIGASVSRMLALFPFEPPLYAKQGIPVSYVGHPLADVIPLQSDQKKARELLANIKPQQEVMVVAQANFRVDLEALESGSVDRVRAVGGRDS